MKIHSSYITSIFCSVLILLSVTTGYGVGTAHAAGERIDMELNVPTSATAGDAVEISTSADIPDVFPLQDRSTELTVTLFVNGEQQAKQTIEVTDGETVSMSFDETFDTSGETDIRVEGALKFDRLDYTIRGEIERTIDIDPEPLGDLSIDISGPTTITQGDSVSYDIGISLPDAAGRNDEGSVILELIVDGETLDSRTVQLRDGDSLYEGLSATFDDAGTKQITVKASGSIAGRELSVSDTRALSVEKLSLGNPQLKLDGPTEVSVDEKTTISGTITLPELDALDVNGDLAVRVNVNGDTVATKTITLSDGDTESFDLGVAFDEEGETEVTVTVVGTIEGHSLKASRTRIVNVKRPTEVLGEIGVSADIPTSVDAGSKVTIDTMVDMPDVSKDIGTLDVTVEVLVDGTRQATREVNIGTSDSRDVQLDFTLASEGSHTVTVVVRTTVLGKEIEKSVTKTVEVKPVEDGIGIDKIGRHQGISISVPESMEDEILQYRAENDVDSDLRAFILATDETRYLVFTNETPTTGAAVVNGFAAERSAQLNGMTFGLIVAKSVTFTTNGEPVSIRGLNENPSTYRMKLVRVDATYQRIATLTDPDNGNEVTAASTVGRLVSNPSREAGVLQNLGAKAGKIAEAKSADDAATVLPNSQSPSIPTFSFGTKMWADAPAQVDAIVVSPGTTAYETLAMLSPTEMPSNGKGRPLLYVVNADFEATNVKSVAEIKQQGSDLDGEVVTLTARLYQQRYSTQETLEHTTGCGETVMQIHTPQGPVCVNLMQDVLLHGGVAWSEAPQSRDDVLFVLGASAFHQDEPQTFEEGRYRIVGEVVSTDRIDENLPDGSLLLLYDIERTGDIDYEGVESETRAIIEDRSEQVIDRLRAGIESGKTGNANETIETVSPDTPATVQFSDEAKARTGLERLSIQSTGNAEDVSVDVTTVKKLPEDAPSLPNRAVKTIDISVGLDDESIKGATFELTLIKDVDYDGGELTVYRLHDGEWQALETSIAAESESEITLTVETPGFSYFAVRETVPDEPTATDQSKDTGAEGSQSSDSSTHESAESSTHGDSGVTETSVPGFSIRFTILGVVFSALLFARRRQ